MMQNVQITKEFKDKQSLLNFVSAMLPGRGLYFTPKGDGDGWLLTYETARDIVDGQCEVMSVGDKNNEV